MGIGILKKPSQNARPYFFYLGPVVLESICYRTRAKRLINKINTTGGLKKFGRDMLGWLRKRQEMKSVALKAILSISLGKKLSDMPGTAILNRICEFMEA